MIFNIAGVFLFRLLGSTLGFISSIFIVRLLGAQESGYYFLVLSLVSMLSTFVSFGATDKLIQSSGANFHSNIEIFKRDSFSLITLVITSSLACVFFLDFFSELIATWLDKPEIKPALETVSYALPMMSLSGLFTGILLGLKRSKLSTLFMSITIPGFMLTFVFFLKLSNANVYAYELFNYYNVAVLLSFSALVCVLCKIFLDKSMFTSGIRFSSFRYPRECVDFWLIGIVNVGISSGLMIVSSPFLTPAEISLLSICTRLCIVINILIVSCNLYAAPYFSQYYAQEDLYNLMIFSKKITRYLSLLTIPFIITLLFWSESILRIFGEEFISGNNILKIVILGQLSSVLVGPCVYLLMMTGNQRKIRINNTIVLLISLPMAYFLSKEFGMLGAACAISFSLILQFFPPFFMVKRSLGFYTHSVNLKL